MGDMMSPSLKPLPASAANKAVDAGMGAGLATALPCLVMTSGTRMSGTQNLCGVVALQQSGRDVTRTRVRGDRLKGAPVPLQSSTVQA